MRAPEALLPYPRSAHRKQLPRSSALGYQGRTSEGRGGGVTPDEFISTWRHSDLNEKSGAQMHFNGLCDLLGVPKPSGTSLKDHGYGFEINVDKTGGGGGYADAWKRGCFAWEYKSPGKDLNEALKQLRLYASDLENPPLLIVSDMRRIELHTNWTSMVQERHVLQLEDLADANQRQKLKWAFDEANVEQLKPKRSANATTEEVAGKFVALAQNLRARGEHPEKVAHFVNRMVFCMFAEDIDLLPKRMFERMLEASLADPKSFVVNAEALFNAMAFKGGRVGFDAIEWFNGGLFEDGGALPLKSEDIRIALEAARANWSEINPSIMGTLFERGLDPGKRSQLGAHYTDAAKIMLIVRPVIIEPLLREWAETRAEIEVKLDQSKKAKSPSARTKAFNEAQALRVSFIERLKNFRVLDPACGSGNFLYLALKALKDIEFRVNFEAEELGLPPAFPTVGPECVKGIEINPFAAELARVSVWIGEIQWMRENNFGVSKDPILKSLQPIECRDALLNEDGTEATWPEADVIVGNPPFLGGKSMKSTLGEVETNAIRSVYGNRLAAFSDLVCYWFEKSRDMLATGKAHRGGLVATKGIAKNANLPVLKRLSEDATIFDAWQNEPWVVNGAAVRVALICFASKGEHPTFRLNGRQVDRINSNLTSGLDTTAVAKLQDNIGSVFIGVQKSGPLSVPRDVAVQWLLSPTNANGRKNGEVLSAYASTDDIVGRPTEEFLIDFPVGLDEATASAFEKPFEYLRKASYDPFRDGRPMPFPEYRISTPSQNSAWWEPHRARPDLRIALRAVPSYLATAETTEHRVFRFLPSSVVPDKSLYAFPYAGLVGFGILQSYIHENWCTYFGNRIGAGNQRRYNASFVYLTFPFPEGLTPNIPAADYAADPRAKAIAAAAARLNELRESWLNPPDLVQRVPEVVHGYPDRILPVDDKAAKVLKDRTLTKLYNERPAWLDNAHRDLDAAVAAAYGWPADLSDDEVLERLFALNQERAARQQ